jgi:4-alpha-glucanotransferase
MHLSLEDLEKTDSALFRSQIQALRKKYASRDIWFDVRIKRDKLSLLYEIFCEADTAPSKELDAFIQTHDDSWLRDYALFRVIKDKMAGQNWEAWPEPYRDRDMKALDALEQKEKKALRFQKWLQWQLHCQFAKTHKTLTKMGIFLMGDIPFLVSRDSADVWARRKNFKLEFSSGAPPDLYFADGQEWGMPPYDWDHLESTQYEYFIQKLRYASCFYDMFRIDHFIGLFRLWVFPRVKIEGAPKHGSYDPPDQNVWEAQGRKILKAFLSASSMLPCAEDLGVVPECATQVLAQEAIPGMEIQRWTRDWDTTGDFKAPEQYRKNAVATLTTHDMNAFTAWWETETLPAERDRFWSYLGLAGEPTSHASAAFLAEALSKVSRSHAIFCIESIQDWLSLGHIFGKADPQVRINIPGVVSPKNWTLRAPVALEEWGRFPFNDTIRKLHRESSRQ